MVLGLCFQIFFFFGRFEKLFSKIVFKCFFSTPKICYTRSFFSSQKQTNKQNKIDYTNLAKPLTVPKILIEFKKKKKKKPTINQKINQKLQINKKRIIIILWWPKSNGSLVDLDGHGNPNPKAVLHRVQYYLAPSLGGKINKQLFLFFA